MVTGISRTIQVLSISTVQWTKPVAITGRALVSRLVTEFLLRVRVVYNNIIELVDVKVLKVTKSLIKVESDPVEVSKEGENF